MTSKSLTNFAKKQPIALGCAFLCLALGAGIYFRRDALTEAQAKLADKTKEWEHIRDNVKNSEQLSEQFSALTQTIPAIESRLVHADQLAINLQYFYKLESETQTKIIDLRQIGVVTNKSSSKASYAGIAYTVSVQGSYPQVMDVLRRIENSEYFSRVRGLALLGSDAGKANTGPVNLSLKLDIQLLGWP
jgi:hypothetical protein